MGGINSVEDVVRSQSPFLGFRVRGADDTLVCAEGFTGVDHALSKEAIVIA
jgi:hypothetical protein